MTYVHNTFVGPPEQLAAGTPANSLPFNYFVFFPGSGASSWREIIASTSAPANTIVLSFSGSPDSAMWDIGIGPVGSEVVLIGGMRPNFNASDYTPSSFTFSAQIPAGSRISMRGTRAGGSGGVNVSAYVLNSGQNSFDFSLGDLITIDTGATTHTKSAWNELTSSNPSPISEIDLRLSGPLNNTGSFVTALFDVGVGASGSEVVVYDNIPINVLPTPRASGPNSWRLPVNIAARERIAIRAQSSSSNVSSRNIGFYGFGRAL